MLNKKTYTRTVFLAEVNKLSKILFEEIYQGENLGCTTHQWDTYRSPGAPCARFCRRRFCAGNWSNMLAELGLHRPTITQARRAMNMQIHLPAGLQAQQAALSAQLAARKDKRSVKTVDDQQAALQAQLETRPARLPRVIRDYDGLPVIPASRKVETFVYLAGGQMQKRTIESYRLR